MYKLLLQFEPVTSKRAIDALVYALSIELYTQHHIDSYQSSATELMFDTSRACVFASIALSSNPLYTVEIVQQKTL